MTRSARLRASPTDLLDGRARIVDGTLARDGIAEIGQLPAEPGLMGIEHKAQHQLAAGVDQFDVHSAGSLAVHD